MPKRVFVAMSGGVDSSVAAALLQEEGYQVVGVTLQIWQREGESPTPDGCCGLEAVESARGVARKLGIPHYVLNFRERFARSVIADFCEEYRRGHTPNPCIVCNRVIKFGTLLEQVRGMEGDYLATGHYARIEHYDGAYHLLKGVDPKKDQSYFLYMLGQGELAYLLFPVGKRHKTEVRKLATGLELPAARRPESQDICFVSDRDYRSFLAERIPLEPGDIVDVGGQVLGRHAGLARYTVGQRQGMGVSSAQRLYVLRLDMANNRLVVGTREQLLTDTVYVTSLSWVAGKTPASGEMMAKVRYRAPEVPVTLDLRDSTAEVRFHQPQAGVATGQAVVFYQGEEVLGGGTICELKQFPHK
ncbi:MAG: tRNA 2-thiouridine(34) synthase MnmA [Chloroflexota bacterium]